MPVVETVHVGVDVGGTNTDAVVLKDDRVVGWAKKFTTADVTSGVAAAVVQALNNSLVETKCDSLNVTRVHIGTTHFVNAVIQRRNLAAVSVVRLCGPASQDLEPFIDFPDELRQVIRGSVHMIDGGYEFDGCTEIRSVNEDEVLQTIDKLKEEKATNVVISGIFSPVNSDQELKVKSLFENHYADASITLSHEIGQIGLLERENAAILNESLKPLCRKTVSAFRDALDKIGLTCPFFLTQNDGTLNSAEQALAQPVNTFASGPTNSMRGAAFLSGVKEAVVADIGGTSTDVGVLIGGFPKEASFKVKVGDVRTNFRMPDVVSIGLGGGSKVFESYHKIILGPESVGYRLEKEAVVFGGQTLTTSDLAVAGGLVEMGDPNLLGQNNFTCNEDSVNAGIARIREMVEETIDQVKTNKESTPVILVGGGSVLIDCSSPLKGTSGVLKPPNFQVANAVGAALSQVSGSVDYTVNLDNTTRADAIQQAKDKATEAAIKAGAERNSVIIADVSEVPLAYLPSNVTRVKVKAVGDLAKSTHTDTNTSSIWTKIEIQYSSVIQEAMQGMTVTGQSLVEDVAKGMSKERKEPTIDPVTGEWLLSEWDVECIAVGAGILGCGGGGSPYLGKLVTVKRLREGHQIKVLTPERAAHLMSDGKTACAVAGMGAPTIMIERLNAVNEIPTAVTGLQDLYNIGQISDEGQLKNSDGAEIKEADGVSYVDNYQPKNDDKSSRVRSIVALFSCEIGGANAMAPLYTAPCLDLPVIDCDGMGRAFPELQQYTPLIYGGRPFPACLSDHNDTRAVVLHADTPKNLENHFRSVCVGMGCGAALAMPPIGRDDILGEKSKVVPHSLSRAWRLGDAVWKARVEKTNPISAILTHEGGKLIFIGKITDIQRRTTGGFARGELTLDGFGAFSSETMNVLFQNENLVAKLSRNGSEEYKVVACVPDLISLVDHEMAESISTEEARYGLRVAVLAMPASPLLRTPEAMNVVGPQAFGYSAEEVTFEPLGDYVHHDPIPPI